MTNTKLAWGIRFARLVAVAMVIGAGTWVTYAVHWHYQHMHECSCIISWELVPFVVAGISMLFALALLALKEVEGAAAVVLPFIKEIQLTKRSTDIISAAVDASETPAAVVLSPTPKPVEQDHAEILEQETVGRLALGHGDD